MATAYLFYGFQLVRPFWSRDGDWIDHVINCMNPFMTQSEERSVFSIEIITFGENGFSQHAIAVAESIMVARRSFAPVLTPELFAAVGEWQTLVYDFCRVIGIKEQTPAWLLASRED